MKESKFRTFLNRYGVVLLLIILFVLTVAFGLNRPNPSDDDPSVPIILSASGNFWVDQKGRTMFLEDADAFFSRNPKIAYGILFCNHNPTLATKLYSEKRSNWLIDKTYAIRDNSITSEAESLTKDQLYEIYCHVLSDNPPSDEYLSALETHLSGGTAYFCQVDNIRTDLADLDKIEPGTTDYIVEKLYIACLTAFTEDGTLDHICNDVVPDISPIPTVMTQDGTWYDQNCSIMDESAVTSFFHNANAANIIISLNFSSNPFLDPEQLPAEKLDEMLLYSSSNKIENYSDKFYTTTLNQMVTDPVDAATLQRLYQLILEKPLGEHQNSWYTRTTLRIIDELEFKYSDETQVNAWKLYGYNNEESWLINYVFVDTLARLTETDVFQQN